VLLAIAALGTVVGRPAASVARQAAACAVPAAVKAAPPTATAAPPAAITRRGVATPSDRPATTAITAPTAAPTAEAAPAAATPDAAAALAAELEAVARALAACLSGGRAPIVAILATERYLGQLYGGGVPLPREDYLALAAELDPVPTEIRAVRDVRRLSDGRATAEVVSVVGNQLLRSRWSFVPAPRDQREAGKTAWRVDAEEPLPFAPPAGAAEIRVVLDDYAITLAEGEVEGPELVLVGNNAGGEDHEMLVLRFDQGLTTLDLLRGVGPGLPEGIAYVGQATVPVGQAVELVLVDLPPGDYAVVCLFPTPRGTPHLALGMAATLTIAAER
jgi:hypothetical protein